MSTPAYEKVKIARGDKRPTAVAYIGNLFTDFYELHGDRRYADDPAVVAGIARLNGSPVTVIGIEKGRTTKERIQHAFGAPNPEGYRKALRQMHQAQKFHRPVVCFVDTSGAYCGIGAEERGQGQAIAENLMEMSVLGTPVISIIIGEGGSGGALALSVADEVWMLENAIYSVISPEGCANILWKNAEKAEHAAAYLKLTAQDALAGGLVTHVLPEEHLGERVFYAGLRDRLSEALAALGALPQKELLERRYQWFRRFGAGEGDGIQT